MRYLSLLIILLLISFGLGFQTGVNVTINKGVDMAQRFLDIELDRDLVEQAIFQYEQRMDGCFPKK